MLNRHPARLHPLFHIPIAPRIPSVLPQPTEDDVRMTVAPLEQGGSAQGWSLAIGGDIVWLFVADHQPFLQQNPSRITDREGVVFDALPVM